MVDVRIERASALDVVTPLLVVGLFEGDRDPGGATRAVDRALGGLIARLAASGELSGELGKVRVLYTSDPRALKAERVAVVGLGPRNRLDREAVRVAAASGARAAQDLKVSALATVALAAGHYEDGLQPADACHLILEATLLALYRYLPFKTQRPEPNTVQSVVLVEEDADRARSFEPIATLAASTAEAVNRTRDLSVGPSNVITPQYLADQARDVASTRGLDVTVWGKADLEERGMRSILAVNAGSTREPALVTLRYQSPHPNAKTLAVVGKGITFDTGGISIKPAEAMEYMRHDMSGAATVIGFAQLAADTALPVNVVGIFAATENMPSGSSYKPGDVYVSYSGTTFEVVNTDAEGRVVLADALAYAVEQRPDAIVDLATLTGGCVVALGSHATGLFANNQPLADLVIAAGERTGERCWQLPMWDVYRKQIMTPMADIKNTGGRQASSITAAFFLKEFVGDVPWVHLDIAGTAYCDSGQRYTAPYNPQHGATGVGVRLLWQFCQLWKDA